jgi:hypothetical protein
LSAVAVADDGLRELAALRGDYDADYLRDNRIAESRNRCIGRDQAAGCAGGFHGANRFLGVFDMDF